MSTLGVNKMHNYECFYRGKRISVQAPSSFAAQEAAARIFKAKKAYEIATVLADKPISPASL